MPMGAAYNSVKAALDHYARQVALEEAPKGIRVNVVSPGCIMVEYQMAMYGKVMSKEEEWVQFSIILLPEKTLSLETSFVHLVRSGTGRRQPTTNPWVV